MWYGAVAYQGGRDFRAAIEDGPGAGKDVLIEKAVTYARESVPDAIAQLRPSENLLRRLVMGKLKEIGAK